MASRRIGRNFHRIRTRLTSCSLPSLEDLIFSQKTLVNAIAKLRKSIHDMSTSLVEWSKLESNQAFYDVFTNRLTLDNVLCLLINDLHNQCTELCSEFKMIKGKHKFIDLLRKKKEAKTTEVGRLRKKIKTLKRVGVKQKGANDTSESELKKALADLDEITATLRTEINNFEITKARAIKDALTTYSQGWLKFSADSQNIFTAQYQIASEMSGKPERQHYKSMDVNQLIVRNTLQKMNLTIPELESPDSRRRSKKDGIKGTLSQLKRRSTRRSLPVVPNAQDIVPDSENNNEREALPDEDFSNLNRTPEKDHYSLVSEHDRVDVYEPVNSCTTTDRDDKHEDPIHRRPSVARTYSSVSSLEVEGDGEGKEVDDERSVGSDGDDDYNYVIPNVYKDKGDENASQYIRTMNGSPIESVTMKQFLSITVPTSTVDDVYLQIADPEYQDIEPSTPRRNRSEINWQQHAEGSPSVRSDVGRYPSSQSDSSLHKHEPSTEHRKRLASRQGSTGSKMSDESGVSAQISETDSRIVEEEKDNEIYAVYISSMHKDQDKDKNCQVLDESDSAEATENDSQSIGNDSEISRSNVTASSRKIYKANHHDTYATYSGRHSSEISIKPTCQQKSKSLLSRRCSNTHSQSNAPDRPTLIKESDSNSAPNSSKQPGDEKLNKVIKKPPIRKKPIHLRGQPKASQVKNVQETEE